MSNLTISLCMIVRDEAEQLPRCLESVASIVDEIIVVDTGSIDDTVAIAQSFGARVIHEPWQYDFATARNIGLEAATGDWILWLDADEQLDLEEGKKLKDLLSRDAINQHQIEGLQFILKSYTDCTVERVSIPRMVRNRPEYRFTGRIHEEIIPSVLQLYPNCHVGQVDIHIHHYGFMSEIVNHKNKIARNIELLLREQAAKPNNPITSFYLAQEYFRCNALLEALDCINEFLVMQDGYAVTMVAAAYKCKCSTLHLLHRYEELVRCSEEGCSKLPLFVDLYHYKAQGFLELKRTKEAIDALQQALQIGTAPEQLPSTIGYGSYVTYYELGRLHETQGNDEVAKKCYSEACQLNADYLPAQEALRNIILRNDN